MRRTGKNLGERNNRRPAPRRKFVHTVEDVERAVEQGKSFQICESLRIKSPRSFKRQPDTFVGKLPLNQSFVDYASVRGIITIDKRKMENKNRNEKPLMYIYEVIENSDDKLIVDAEIILCETHSEGICLWPFWLS